MRVLCVAGSQILNYVKPVVSDTFPAGAIEYVTTEKLRAGVRAGLLEIRGQCYDAVVLATYDIDVQRRLEEWQIYLGLTGARRKFIVDLNGSKIKIGWAGIIFRAVPRIIFQKLTAPLTARLVGRDVRKLALKIEGPPGDFPETFRKICYLRTDQWYGIKAGGSVTHIAGVSKGFTRLGADLFFVSTDRLELVDEQQTPVHVFKYASPYSNVSEMTEIAHNRWLPREAATLIESEKPDLIYQRYSLLNYSGVVLSRRYNLPFVLEYNGSEVWIAKNWGTPLKNQKLAEEIELLNLRSADLVVVVSEAMGEQVQELGIGPDKILVNPNGVDVERVHPEIDGSGVREKHGLQDKLVVGFMGTFGPWHGAEVLAKAIKPLVEQAPDMRFLFVGDGQTMSEVKEILKRDDVGSFAVLTGMVPQEKGPEYLAACDILVSPHVPNADGSKFFGSPTKLFEYMSMGRAIVASDLDQIGDVLTHEKNALLVTPGSVDELVSAVVRLVDPDLRRRLADGARRDAVDKFTWTRNAKNVIDALRRTPEKERV